MKVLRMRKNAVNGYENRSKEYFIFDEKYN